jgi:thiol-disulfide isomerase/thioredoxin
MALVSRSGRACRLPLKVEIPMLIQRLLLACAALLPFSAFAIDPGAVAPEAAGVVLQGPEGIKLSKLRTPGRVVVVDFWASWCGPCVQAIPELNAMREGLVHEGFGDRFEVLGVSIDNDVKLAKRFLERIPVSYPVVDDVLGVSSQTYGIWRLPATFLIAPDGRIQYIYHGYGAGFTADLRQRILDLLRPEKTPSHFFSGGVHEAAPEAGQAKTP